MFTRALIADLSDTPLKRVLRLLLVTASVFAATLISMAFSNHGARITPVWLGNAVALAFCLKNSPRRWPALLLAAFAANVCAATLSGDTLPLAAGLSVCNGLETGLCAVLLMRLVGPEMDLTRRRDLMLFVASALVSTAASATLASAMLGLLKSSGVVMNVAVWTMADAIGLIMLTPLLLMAADVRAQLKARPPTLRRLTPLALLAVVTVWVFSQETYPTFFLIPPIWAVAAVELEFLGLTVGALIVGMVAVVATYLGHGPIMMVRADEIHRLALLQFSIAFSTVTLLQFTAEVVQRRRLTQSLEAMHRQAEKRRAGAVESHRRAQMAESVAGLGYWRIDLKTGSIDWSPQIYSLFGLPRSMPPQRGTITDLIHPEDVDLAKAGFQRIAETGEPQHSEARIITPDGTLKVLRSWSTAELDAEGKVAAVFYVMMDVTEQRRTEMELRQARDAAEQAVVVKAEFLANMSHELRTPLTSIIGFTALAQAETEMPDSVRHCIDRVAVASKGLLTLVNDVLDFSKLEAGEIRIAPRPMSMAELSREVLDIFGAQALGKGIGLELEGEDAIPQTVALDPDRLRQVLINLVGNAVKFTEAGKVTLKLVHAAGQLHVSVIDTGPGISADRRSALFQRFSQVDGSSTRIYGGTGLGLAICKGLVEAMGGEIGVDTEEGRGSRFWFELPALPVDMEEAASATASVAALHLGNRFLVVDDNRANRDLVRAILSSLGAEIVEAENGLEAVDTAMEQPFDVILMDLRMPGLNGEEAVARIRQGGPNANCPILAFSASADPGQEEQLRRAGFDGCLTKPFTLTDIMSAIETALAPPPSSDSSVDLRNHG